MSSSSPQGFSKRIKLHGYPFEPYVDSRLPRCNLDFGMIFYRIATVSADDGGASGSEIGPTGLRRENGAAVFATTHWSVVLEAQGESPAAQDALEKLCRTPRGLPGARLEFVERS